MLFWRISIGVGRTIPVAASDLAEARKARAKVRVNKVFDPLNGSYIAAGVHFEQ